MQRNPRRPLASQVLPHGGLGLGLPVVTSLPTRQPAVRRELPVQVVPIDWRPPRPRAFGRGAAAPQAQPSRVDDCTGCR